MTTVIKFPGKYEIYDDSYNNLDIRASNIIFNGNGHTLYGWVHIGSEFHRANNIKIINLTIQPPTNIYSHTDDICPVCNALIFQQRNSSIVKSEALVYVHGNKCELISCNLIPNKELDSHVTISHTNDSNINDIKITSGEKEINYLKFEDN